MRRFSKEEFIEKARSIHGDKYDYSEVEYVNNLTKVCIICPEHGEFWMTPANHNSGHGCPLCAKNHKDDKETFVEKAKKIHGNKFDYSKVNYVNSDTKVCMVCPIHGEFWQTPHMHLRGRGCYECSGHKLLGNEKFIEKAKNVHGDKYDYSKVNYIGSKDKVCIICHEHGEFWQIPNSHLMGIGCPMCSASKLENEVGKALIENCIKFVPQKKFSWMGDMKLDFYLPEKKIAIECQGIQHFEPIGFFGGEDALIANKERDKRKRFLCENNGIKLIYYFNNKKYFGSYEKEAHNLEELKEMIK